MKLHETKIELLRKVDLFTQLREYELDIIAGYSDMCEYRKKSVIFSYGSPAEELYIVYKGLIGIISIEDKNDVAIAQIIPGESFGEMDFLAGTQRSASALADDDSILLQFPAKDYKVHEIYQKHPYISAQMLYRLFGIISERIWRVNNMLYSKTDWLQDIHKQLLYDKLTGLYNQSFFKEDLVNLLPDLGSRAALLMIKPDNFKEVNDKYGHEAGDNVLHIMAIFLQSELGEKDMAIRYSGDEFVAILADTDRHGAVARAKEISRAFKSIDFSEVTGSSTIKIIVSTGIAIYPEDCDNSKNLLELARKRMFNARNAGGNRISIK